MNFMTRVCEPRQKIVVTPLYNYFCNTLNQQNMYINPVFILEGHKSLRIIIAIN